MLLIKTFSPPLPPRYLEKQIFWSQWVVGQFSVMPWVLIVCVRMCGEVTTTDWHSDQVVFYSCGSEVCTEINKQTWLFIFSPQLKLLVDLRTDFNQSIVFLQVVGSIPTKVVFCDCSGCFKVKNAFVILFHYILHTIVLNYESGIKMSSQLSTYHLFCGAG